MRFNSLALLLAAGTVSNALPAPQNDPSLPTEASSDPAVASQQIDQLASFAEEQVRAALEGNNAKRGTCNANNVAIRREWNDLSKQERKAYTDAVLCLQAKTGKTPASFAAGVRSRFDDFVANHIDQTLFIHYTGTFLAWHRYFTWQYEQALRNECGYKGYQPYWNWALTAQSGLEKSAMLDGSEYSMSGNGEAIPNQGEVVIAGTGPPEIRLPPGTGGGCVKSGPFKNMSKQSLFNPPPKLTILSKEEKNKHITNNLQQRSTSAPLTSTSPTAPQSPTATAAPTTPAASNAT